ncbi:unnamed protein product [Tilletia caries]|nr:unnamed protein product [Tilletia caries]
MASTASPSTLKGKRFAKMAAAASSMSDKENQDPNQSGSLSRSGSTESGGFRLSGKFSSNSSLSIAIHPPSKSNNVSYRLASSTVELPPTPITAGLDIFPGAQGKSLSPALQSIELPLTPTSAGFNSSTFSSSSLDDPSESEFNSVEFEAQLRSIIAVPATPKIGTCESGVFDSFPSSPSSSSLSDIMTDFPPHLSEAEESMLDDDVDEDDDEHEAQTPVKHFVGMSRGGAADSSMGMGMSRGVSMQREATVSLISTPAQLEMQTALQRRMDDHSDATASAVLASLGFHDNNNNNNNKGKGKASMAYADLNMLSSNLGQMGLHDHPIGFALNNALGLNLGSISNAAMRSPSYPSEVAAIILEAPRGLPQVRGLVGLGVTLEELSQPSLAPPGQIVPAASLPKHTQAVISEEKVSVNAPWQQTWQDADLQLQQQQQPQSQRVRAPLSDSRRSSNATATPLSVVAVNRSRLGSSGQTPTNSPASSKPVGTPSSSSPNKRNAASAALYLVANGKENQDPLSPSSSSSSSSSGSGFNKAATGASPALSQNGHFGARKRSRVAMR